MDLTWYDRQGRPIDLATADRLLGDLAYKRIALTKITSSSDDKISFEVSTVWLGFDLNFGDGPPILFETMVFRGDVWRWHTEADARAGHAEIVASVAATVPDEQVENITEGGRP